MSRKLSSVFNLTISEFALPLVCIIHRSKKAGRLLYASTFLANSALFAMKSDHYNKFSFGLISDLQKNLPQKYPELERVILAM